MSKRVKEERMSILQVKKKGAGKWQGQTLELLEQASNEILQMLPCRAFIGRG